MRRVAAVTVLALAFGAVLVGPGASVASDAPDPSVASNDSSASVASDAAEPRLVSVGDERIWPYVGPEPSFDRRASPINVVVRDDPGRVRRHLAREGEWNRSDAEWVEDASDETAVVADERVPWRDAPGAHRYVYVADRGWTTERYQLHRGTYFGARHHLRAYGPRDDDWTAVQAHAEHWDWFTITHTVDSVEVAQRRVEAAFLGEPGFAVRRVYHANGDAYDADGWTTVVAVALAPLLARWRRRDLRWRRRGLSRRLGDLRRRLGALADEPGRVVAAATGRNRRRVALVAALAALPLVVRFGGVLCERFLPWLSPGAVVALWYPVLVGGVPLAAYGFGRRLPPAEAGGLAALGIGAGLVLDYASLGVTALPVPVAAHRAVAVAAVGLLAAGAGARGDTPDGTQSAAAGTEAEREAAETGSAGDAADGWPTALRAGAALWAAAVVAGHLV